MTQPAEDNPDDPVKTLAALAAARRPENYRQLRHTLKLWRLRAAAYSADGFEARLEAARTGTEERTPIEHVIPDWDDRVAAARQQRDQN
jgi:hypothetical protein